MISYYCVFFIDFVYRLYFNFMLTINNCYQHYRFSYMSNKDYQNPEIITTSDKTKQDYLKKVEQLIKKIKPKSHKYSHHKGNDTNLFQEWVKVFLFFGLQDTSPEFGQWEEENHYDKSIIILRLKELIYPQEYENQNQWKLHQEHLIHHRSTEAEPQCKCIFSWDFIALHIPHIIEI